jgi:hypothetical protein
MWELAQVWIECSLDKTEGLKEYFSNFLNYFDLLGQVLFLVFGCYFWTKPDASNLTSEE